MRLEAGQALFRTAVRAMAEAGREALARAGLQAEDVDWWIPHQANGRITREAGRLLGIPPERTVDVIRRYGNSSSATIPLALAEHARSGRLRRGDTILMTAVGAGMISAACVLRW